MVSFNPHEEDRAFAKVAKEFAIEHFRPAARESEVNKAVPHDMLHKLRKLGFTALELPERYGGLELPLLSQVQILEQLAYGDLAMVQGIPGAGECASIIRMKQNNPVFNSYFMHCLDGKEQICALCGPKHHMLQFEKKKDGYVITGETAPLKMARYADYLLIGGTDSTGEEVLLWAEKSEEMSWKTIEGDYRLGLLDAGFSKVVFHQAFLNKNSLIAYGKEAVELAELAWSRIRIREAAKEAGLMSAALDYAIQYTSQRKAFGKEIAKFQGVSFTLAQMAIEKQKTRHLILCGAAKIDEQNQEAVRYSLHALNSAHHSMKFITDSAVQLLGGHGYVEDHPVEKWMRDAQAQAEWFEKEFELMIKAGDWLLNNPERGRKSDQLRTVFTPESS